MPKTPKMTINRGRAGGDGSTTKSASGILKKTCYFTEREWFAIRLAAFEGESTYTDVVREAVRNQLKVKK